MRNVRILLTELVHFRAPYRAEQELDVASGKGLRLPHGCTIAVGALTWVGYLVATGGASALR